MEILKIPIQLIKRLSDGPGGEQKWQIEVPEEYRMKGVQMEPWKGYWFLIVGPFSEEEEIRRIINKEGLGAID